MTLAPGACAWRAEERVGRTVLQRVGGAWCEVQAAELPGTRALFDEHLAKVRERAAAREAERSSSRRHHRGRSESGSDSGSDSSRERDRERDRHKKSKKSKSSRK